MKHYKNSKKYDVIDICKDYDLNFNRGNIIKYVIRAGKKESEIEDLLKAVDYLNREIEHLAEHLTDSSFIFQDFAKLSECVKNKLKKNAK